MSCPVSGLYIAFYLVVAASMTSVTVTYDALIADKSHPSQRGRVGAAWVH